MEPLARNQAETLFAIVKLKKERHVIPSVKEISKTINKDYAATRGRISRLRKKKYLKKRGSKFILNGDLVTEKESTQAVLLGYELIEKNEEKRISKKDLCAAICRNKDIDIKKDDQARKVIKMAIDTKYFEEVVGTDELRATELIVHQLEYLKLIAGK